MKLQSKILAALVSTVYISFPLSRSLFQSDVEERGKRGANLVSEEVCSTIDSQFKVFAI